MRQKNLSNITIIQINRTQKQPNISAIELIFSKFKL